MNSLLEVLGQKNLLALELPKYSSPESSFFPPRFCLIAERLLHGAKTRILLPGLRRYKILHNIFGSDAALL